MPLHYKSLHITFLIPFHPPTKHQRGENSATSPSQPLLPPPLCQHNSPAVPPCPPREHSSLLPSPPAPRLSSHCAATRSCGQLRARAANQAGPGLVYSLAFCWVDFTLCWCLSPPCHTAVLTRRRYQKRNAATCRRRWVWFS